VSAAEIMTQVDDDIIEIDVETEDLALVLTTLVKELVPNADCGGTYEILVNLLVQFLHESVHDLEIKDYAKRILETHKQSKSKH